MRTGPTVLIMIHTEIPGDNWYAQQHKVSMSRRSQASESCLPASKPSVPGQRPHSQEHKRFYFWHRLQAAQIGTQRHQKELTESLHREHTTRLRPSNTTEIITVHTVTKTLQTDQSLQGRNKRKLHRYFTSWRLTPKSLDTYQSNMKTLTEKQKF